MTYYFRQKPLVITTKLFLYALTTFGTGACTVLNKIDMPNIPIVGVGLKKLGNDAKQDVPVAETMCQLEKAWEYTPKVEAPDLWSRLLSGYKLPKIEHKRVDEHRQWYAKHPDYLGRVIDRGAPYLHYIVEQIEARDMPMEIALLPIVESAFDPFAYSRSRASGMWQFIPGTGKMLGLKQNWWYDGRRDITASTDAALTYLTQLNKRFNGDWTLALAAYNSGAGNVSKAIRKNVKRNKPTDFFSLDLPRETRYYVPKLLALAEIFKSPEEYGIPLSNIPNQPYFAKVDIETQLDLAQAAALAEIDMDSIYQLNPAFNRWATDPDGPHQLLVPIDKQQQFEENLSAMPVNERVVWQRYKIKNGDTLNKIAKKYRVSTSVLKQSNNMRGNRLRAGKSLMVPVAAAGSSHYVASVEERLKKNQARVDKSQKNARIDYTVKSGDSMWKIANRYGISTRSIARWNNMAPTDPIRPGQELAIWPKVSSIAPKTDPNKVVRKVSYRVRNGDSLYRIAQRFKLNIKDIQRWNDLQAQKYLQPGQSITLFVNVTN